MGFSKDFIWGVATSSYQIEGAAREDGKADSVWDEFCRVPGATFQGHSGDVACDNYHRFREDIALMKQLGIKAYRFSFSWPRILPQGIGAVNEAGLRFYEELVDELLKNQITPYATLFHWDYPVALQSQGGWLNPDSPIWFENYAELIAKRFAGKIKYYFTLNEPQCFIGLGYRTGEHAPGLKLSDSSNLLAVHNVLLAHGRAVKALRNYGGEDVKIGLAQCGRIFSPNTNSPKDVEAARRATLELPQEAVGALFSVALWSDPILKGDYPEAYYRNFANVIPAVTKDDLAIISQPIDFYGQNIYHSTPVQADGDRWKTVFPAPGSAKTAIGWPIEPSCVYWAIKYLNEEYAIPVLISENGMSAHDVVSLDGQVHDPNRIDYLHRHLLSLRNAANEGLDVMGYFEWSLLDNFEWSNGYNERFGIVYVDYATQARIPKDSAYWYQQVIGKNGENL